MKTRLGIITPNHTDACSWYRTLGPWLAFEKQNRHVEIVNPPRMDWTEAARLDCLFMQRPYLKEHLLAAQIAAKAGVPVWVDFDDLLWDVPRWNQAYRHFANEECQAVLRQLCQLAYAISCTTEALAREIYLRTGRHAIVVPNALQNRFPLHMPRPQDDAEPTIYWWRGGKQHKRDHEVVFNMFRAVADADPKAQFFLFGDDPWWAEDVTFKGRMEVIPDAVDVLVFHDELCRRRPSVLLYGLNDHVFNECKSACSWLEATMAGSIVVGPNWAEWHRPGIIHYEPGSLDSAAAAAVKAGQVNRLELWKQSAEYLERYRTDSVNQIRATILHSCITRKPLFNEARDKQYTGG